MEKLPWLKKYSHQTTGELVSLEGKYRTDSIVVAFEEALTQKMERRGREALSAEEFVILAVEALEREVNNDGYDGFFVNSSKEFAPVVVDSLNRIGCKEAADLTNRAISSLGIKGPLTTESIDRAMSEENEERKKILQACDDRYYQTAGDLANPLLEFIKANSEKIKIGL